MIDIDDHNDDSIIRDDGDYNDNTHIDISDTDDNDDENSAVDLTKTYQHM